MTIMIVQAQLEQDVSQNNSLFYATIIFQMWCYNYFISLHHDKNITSLTCIEKKHNRSPLTELCLGVLDLNWQVYRKVYLAFLLRYTKEKYN